LSLFETTAVTGHNLRGPPDSRRALPSIATIAKKLNRGSRCHNQSTLAVASPLPTFAAQHMIGLKPGAASYDGMAL
jgi:hypothetical protein